MDTFINGMLFGLGWMVVSAVPTAVCLGYCVWRGRRDPVWGDTEAEWTR